MIFPAIDPVALDLGPLVIRWYALAYVAGIVLGYHYLVWLDKNATPRILGISARDNLILYAVLGIILGGRLGYVLFYNWGYYSTAPLEILHIWQGGMSFHGGMLGIIVAFYLFAYHHKLPYLRVMDYVAATAPIGLFFGRIANFINAELYGRVTNSSWGMIFPHSDGLPRHPSQLYEATFEGLVLFVLIYLCITRARALRYYGMVSGIFLLGYGLARFFIEFVREPDAQLGFVLGGFSMGQLLCLPMMAVGLFLVLTASRRPAS